MKTGIPSKLWDFPLSFSQFSDVLDNLYTVLGGMR